MNATAVRIKLDGLEFSARRSLVDFAARTIASVRTRIAAARQARAAQALLLDMSDRDLRDIGLTRYELHQRHYDGQV